MTKEEYDQLFYEQAADFTVPKNKEYATQVFNCEAFLISLDQHIEHCNSMLPIVDNRTTEKKYFDAALMFLDLERFYPCAQPEDFTEIDNEKARWTLELTTLFDCFGYPIFSKLFNLDDFDKENLVRQVYPFCEKFKDILQSIDFKQRYELLQHLTLDNIEQIATINTHRKPKHANPQHWFENTCKQLKNQGRPLREHKPVKPYTPSGGPAYQKSKTKPGAHKGKRPKLI